MGFRIKLPKGTISNSTIGRIAKIVLIYLFAPFVFIAILEGLIGWSGYGISDEPFLQSKIYPGKYVTNDNFGQLYFPFSGAQPNISINSMFIKKPENGIRIFVVGENSASGIPWTPNGKTAQFIHQLLRETFSENSVEVLDLSVPGMNSHGMLDIIKRLAKYDPDAIIIYPGHNEFYGSLAPASVDYLGLRRGNIKLYLRLHKYRLFQLLKNLYVNYVRKIEPIDIQTDALIESIAREIEIKPNSKLYEAVLENFSDNLNEMLEYAESKDLLLLGVVPTSNYADKAPFKACLEDISDHDKWLAEIEKGRAFLQAEKEEDALSYFSEAVARLGSNADVEYLIAKALAQSGDIYLARDYFRMAVDSDCLPFRSPTEFNRKIEKLFGDHGQPVVNVGLLMDRTSTNGIRGDEFFLDAVHFSLLGVAAMAERIGSELIFRFGGKRRLDPEAAYLDALINKVGITPIDIAVAELRITSIRSHWPYKENERTVPPFSGFRDDYSEELAYKVVEEELSWRDAHRIYADSLYDSGFPNEAAKDYRALVVNRIDDIEPYHRLAYNLIKKGFFEEAFVLLEEALQIEETAFALKWKGSILLGSSLEEEAVEVLIQAHLMEPFDLETLYNLTSALVETERLEDAKETLRSMIAAAPNYPGIFDLADRIRKLE